MSAATRQRFLLDELRAAVPSAAVRSPEVSAGSVAWHLHHLYLSMSGISRALLECDTPPEGRPTPTGRLVLTTGFIPRGGAKSPDVAIPREESAPDELAEMLDRAEELLDRAAETGRDAWFRHFVLGSLRRDQALKFVRVHNRHHLRIIRDILKKG